MRLGTLPALILALALPGARTQAGVEGSAVLVHVLDADGRPSPKASVVARCPEGPVGKATTDAEGFAVIAAVPPCPLTIGASAAEPGATVHVDFDRLEGRTVSILGGGSARDLPSARTLWSLPETAEPAAIVDRIDGAGLHLGEPGRFSMRGTSWTQNVVLLDGVDLTDPLRGGTPLVDPDLDVLERTEAVSGLARPEQQGPGVALDLVPLVPARSWKGTVEGSALTSSLQAGERAGEAPSIARFGSLVDGRGSASGPLTDRLRVLLSARFGRVQRFERDESAAREARLLSGGAQLLYQPNDRDALRVLASVQAGSRPLVAPYLGDAPRETVEAFGGQARWTRVGARATVTAFAGVWSGRFEPPTVGAQNGQPIERLRDGPVPELVYPARSRRSNGTVGASLALAASRLGALWHAPRFGMAAARASGVERAGTDGPIAETVDGLPGRVWEYAWAGPDSHRHVRDLAVWAADQLVLRDRVLVEAGLRLVASAGAAEGAESGVSWTTVSPRVSGRLRLTHSGSLTAFGGYADYPHRLLLAPLAFGDPNGPQAAVYLWNDANGDGRYDPVERGVLVARVGPGAADRALAAIDPGLRPPRTRELVAGLEVSPGRDWIVWATAFDRRERDLMESVDVGVPLSGYTVRYLPDPGGDILGPQDDQLLPVYDRKPETFGLDRYLLTNPPDHTGLHQGFELRVEKRVGPRFAFAAGGTVSRTEIAGANRGFRVMENDQGLVGELYDDPNADTFANGRSFFDRAFTLKAAAAYRAPRDWRLGALARYQDGQPFGRLVVVPDLAQGPEAVPATPRGQIVRGWAVDESGRYIVPSGHRFTYTLTVDARVEKGWRLGARRLALLAEAFNVLGTRNEVEEDPVWGPRFRAPTAVQPPRAVRLGLRLDF